MRKTYYFGATRVAVSNNGTLAYLHADHLGSASLATTPGGGIVTGSEIRYFPFGETRTGGAGLPTDRRYTGQREEADLGLYDYNARYYDPVLGRFISADSIVPDPSQPQDFNRYSYTRNNPVKYNDPTGHWACGDHYDPACIENEDEAKLYASMSGDEMILRQWGIIPGRPVSDDQLKSAMIPKAFGLTFGLVEFTYSVIGTAIEGLIMFGVASVDGPLPLADLIAGTKLGSDSYEAYFEPIENTLGWSSLGLTAYADILDGYTYVDPVTGDIVIGQNTVTDIGFALVGQSTKYFDNLGGEVLGLASGPVDATINGIAFLNDVRGLAGFDTSSWELRVSISDQGNQYVIDNMWIETYDYTP